MLKRFFQSATPSPALSEWLKSIYSGTLFERSSDEIKARIEVHPDFHSTHRQDPEVLILHFLYLCVSETSLQNSCMGSGCRCSKVEFPTEQHSIADHLKELFFSIMSLKYPSACWQTKKDEYVRVVLLQDHLLDLGETADDIVTRSMLATILPLITDKHGYPFFHPCDENRELYTSFHPSDSALAHPYVRLSGVLSLEYFSLDARKFDMRGVDLAGSKFYSLEYYHKTHEFIVPSRDILFSSHANFQDTDLRFANLSNTEFRLAESLENTNYTDANIEGSNLLALRGDSVHCIPE